ncbi:MAG: LytR/AlgR family response regulator transcription factor, partial [Saprospiraceae bacterium]
WLADNQVDLLFLDINMPFINGLELLRMLKEHPPVIFTTAYPEHALESFEFNVVDYLVKPISFERFLQAVNKALRFLEERTTQPEEQVLIFKEGSNIFKVKIADIDYIESMQNYVKIHTNERRFMVLMTLKELMQQLPTNDFYQIHRSYIIHLNKIEKIEQQEVVIAGTPLPISKRNRSDFLAKFKAF